ncbi:MAG: glutaredoxin family protein [Actinomycetota bacterium]
MTNQTAETVTITTQPCMFCCQTSAVDGTPELLGGKGIPYRVVDLSEHSEAIEYVKDLDATYMQAPIVVVDEHDHWSGFRPDQIERAASKLDNRHP